MPNPQDPQSLATGTIALHEVFLSWMQAGFTREEALKLCMAVLTAHIGGKPNE